jgi:hypothetical protein
MRINVIKIVALTSIILTPIALMLVTSFRWGTGSCAGTAHGSVFVLMIFAAYLATTKNPYRAIAACLIYLPIGYIFTTEPCTASRSQGAGGLIYLISPLFVLFIFFGSFIGGWILRLIFGLANQSTNNDELNA